MGEVCWCALRKHRHLVGSCCRLSGKVVAPNGQGANRYPDENEGTIEDLGVGDRFCPYTASSSLGEHGSPS